MLSFVGVLLILFVISLFCSDSPSFGKAKMAPVKAIMALLIVADHMTFHVDLAWIQPVRKWGAPIVAMFLFISGYGLLKSYMSKGPDYLKGFFRKRIWKVALPALVAYCLYLLVCFKTHDFGAEFMALLTKGIPLLPYSWFVEVMVLLYIGFWLSFRFAPERLKLSLTVIWSVLLVIVTVAIGYDRCWWVGTLAFPTGMLYAKNEQRLNVILSRSRLAYAIGFGACLFMVALFYKIGNEYLYTICYMFIPLALALVLSRLPLQNLNVPVIGFLAGISYEMYLCQGIAMEFLHGSVVNIHNDYLYILAVYAMVIVLAFITERLSSSLSKLPCHSKKKYLNS